jgi:carbon monoxide dehydrogenase subunit G
MRTDITRSFVVKAPAATVWDFLTDPARVARCLPGAAITHQIDERTHAGTITVKVGPVAATYRGTMRFERLDPAARSAEIVANGQDVRGKGAAELRMTSALVERGPGETEVAITSQVTVMGVLAQFGSRMIQDVGDRLFDTFVAAARVQLEEPGGPAAPREPAASSIEVLSFGSAVVGRAAARALAKPAVWVGAALLVLIVYWLLRR